MTDAITIDAYVTQADMLLRARRLRDAADAMAAESARRQEALTRVIAAGIAIAEAPKMFLVSDRGRRS